MNIKFYKIFLYLFVALILIQPIFSTNEMHLQMDGWCRGIDIPFTLFNHTSYQQGDPRVTDTDSSQYVQRISNANVIIHNGPFRSLPILVQTTTDSNGEFTARFPTSNNYLVTIQTSLNFSNYEEILTIENCRFVDDEENQQEINQQTETQQITTSDKTFNYLNNLLTLNLQETRIQAGNEISVLGVDRNYLEEINIEIPDKFWKGFIINGQRDFENLVIEYNVQEINNLENLLFYNTDSEQWIQINQYQEENNIIIIYDADFGLYAVTGNHIQEEVITQSVPQQNNEVIDLRGTASVSTNDNGIDIIPIAGLLLIVILFSGIVFIVFTIIKKNKSNPKEKKNKHDHTLDHHKDETELNTYNETYNKTKQYVITYKDQYARDQIYRALERAHVPKDVIDKVFLEVYN